MITNANNAFVNGELTNRRNDINFLRNTESDCFQVNNNISQFEIMLK
jgi:hypothetical protein